MYDVVKVSGVDADSFWRWLADRIRVRQSTWLWQLGACAGLTSLGFWGLLESGLWRLSGDDPLGGSADEGGKESGKAGLCVITDPPTIILASPRHAKGHCRFVDLRNLGVDQWQQVISDVPCAEPGRVTLADASATGRQCAEARATALSAWLMDWYATVSELSLGGLRATAAAQAWQGWRHSYLSVPLLVHNEREATNRERSALYGGRCECGLRSRAAGTIYQIDATAHYPAIAMDTSLPGRLCSAKAFSGTDLSRAIGDGALAICRARIATSVPAVPCRVGGLTIWPVGEFNTVLCWPEIELAREYGAQVDVIDGFLYEPADPFGGFVQKLWGARQEAELDGRHGRRSAIKRLLNSLIGKSAAVGRYWRDEPDQFHPQPFAQWEDISPEDGVRRRWRSIGWRVQREVVEGEHPDSMPALAAWVYSVGRCRLWRWMNIAGKENVYYVDTDSVWVNQQGFDRLDDARAIAPRELGRLRCVAVHKWAEFHGVKYYSTPDGTVCAGMSESATITTDGGFEFYRAETVSEALRLQRKPGETLRGVRLPEHRPYRLGTTLPDGRVVPFRISQESCPLPGPEGDIIVEGG